MPEVLDECVKKVKAQGKSESSAYAICTTALKKAGKLDDDFMESLSDVDEGSLEFDELMVYIDENALETWSAPTKRKDIPASHFFDQKNKKYPYRNRNGTVNCAGVMAAWKMAHGARSDKKASSSIISKIKPYRDKCMKSKTKDQSDQSHRVSLAFPFSFPEDVDLASAKTIDIQILKQGKWRHPWYGILNFDQRFFDIMIRNFDAGIPQDEISFDFNHRPDWGAACWVEKLFTANGGKDLMATVDLTKRGRDSIQNKEFRYFSSSYRDDYVEIAFEEGEDDNGNKVDKEIKISHGPTLLGGGLTNRPFIKGMQPVSLSEDGSQIVELMEVTDSVNKPTDKEVDEEMKVKLSELKSEQEALLKRIKDLEDQDDGATKEDLEAINTALKELSEKIENAEVTEKQKEKLDEMTTELEASKEKVKELEKALEDKDGSDKELEDLRTQNKELSEKVTTLSDAVTKLLEDKKVMAKERFETNTKSTMRELKDMGVFPATLKILEPVLLSDAAQTTEITLSEKDGDKEVEVKLNLADVFKRVFESVPKEFRFSDSESIETITTPSGDVNTLSEDDVQKYADENKLSYADALIELSKQGKI